MEADIRRAFERMRELRAEYAELHRAGMAALAARDLSALNAAIVRESEIINEQRMLLQRFKSSQDAALQRMMFRPRASDVPARGDVLLRPSGNGYELVDAVSRQVIARDLPTIAAAIEEARHRDATDVWQQHVDGRGRPLGDPFRLLRRE